MPSFARASKLGLQGFGAKDLKRNDEDNRAFSSEERVGIEDFKLRDI